MGDALDPTQAIVTDEEIVAGLARLLRTRGPLGALNVVPAVLPTVQIGALQDVVVTARSPLFRFSDSFGAAIFTNAAANTVHADTTALPAGDYDLLFQIHCEAANIQFNIQHRDAANALTAMSWLLILGPTVDFLTVPFAYTLGTDERLRILNIAATGAGNRSTAKIWARLR